VDEELEEEKIIYGHLWVCFLMLNLRSLGEIFDSAKHNPLGHSF